MGLALIHSQERCRGEIDNVVLRGIDFLNKLAKKYGAKFLRGKKNEIGGNLRVWPRAFRKFERFHRDRGCVIPFLRRHISATQYLSSFVLEMERALLTEGRPQRMTIRESLRELMSGCSTKDWFSLHKSIFT